MSRFRGSTLIEVVIALGLLGSLLVAVAGMVTTGSRQIRAGGLRSRALTIARTVAEQMAGWTFRQSLERLGCSGDSTRCQVTSGDALRPWQALAREHLPQAELELVVSAVDGAELADSRALRVTVVVSWREGRRSRSLSLLWLRH